MQKSMNKIKYLFMAASLATFLVACDDDHKPEVGRTVALRDNSHLDVGDRG